MVGFRSILWKNLSRAKHYKAFIQNYHNSDNLGQKFEISLQTCLVSARAVDFV